MHASSRCSTTSKCGNVLLCCTLTSKCVFFEVFLFVLNRNRTNFFYIFNVFQFPLKLGDFGLAKIMTNDKTYTMCGTTDYLSPELIQNAGYSYSVDYWALGILIFEFFVGETPFPSNKYGHQVYQSIVHTEVCDYRHIFANCF